MIDVSNLFGGNPLPDPEEWREKLRQVRRRMRQLESKGAALGFNGPGNREWRRLSDAEDDLIEHGRERGLDDRGIF